MKKLLSVAVALLMMGSVSFAQDAKTTSTTTNKTEVKHMKKDGTPDKRYKENRTKKTATKETKMDKTSTNNQ